ncbi:unnamed protein product [Cylindrotheca closterium]|uniref:glucan 1,3-beta-glucosidase n=1 Tax=Cylindrotheca closterium TaxID=2856 RepID=A0AAD2GAE0_9STRA|nr:unnamed protein product [Cylindrotheca closterium]
MDSTFSKSWIRGVNIGGWLLMERWITPYMFAITDCHTTGESLCFYPGQISAPPTTSPHHQYCDLFHCEPHLIESVSGKKDFPADEYTLSQSFDSKDIAEKYFSYHFDNFVGKNDVIALNDAGVTHVKVPMPHWIKRETKDDPWVGGRWLYFIRFVGWCREYGIEVWVDIQTAPGSQNGFDHSGQLLAQPTCEHWSSSAENVERSLHAVNEIAQGIMNDSLRDVVTGFGILHEPFSDCDVYVIRDFSNMAFESVRSIMGSDTHVFMGDSFDAAEWNSGWWTDPGHSHTYLDSHYFHVFGERNRALSPKQHIALLCTRNARDTSSCCYEDAPTNQIPSRGISRIVGKWTAAFDTLTALKLKDVMANIQQHGEALEFNRTITEGRMRFLSNFVHAQMVTYESMNSGVSSGWFFHTLKTEGGAFLEWNFLYGIKQGWIQNLPPRERSAESMYGSCESIATKTSDDTSIVHEFPDPNQKSVELWLGDEFDDDYVISHAASIDANGHTIAPENTVEKDFNLAGGSNGQTIAPESIVEEDFNLAGGSEALSVGQSEVVEAKRSGGAFPLFVMVLFCYGIWKVFFAQGQSPLGGFRNQHQYTDLEGSLGRSTELQVRSF